MAGLFLINNGLEDSAAQVAKIPSAKRYAYWKISSFMVMLLCPE